VRSIFEELFYIKILIKKNTKKSISNSNDDYVRLFETITGYFVNKLNLICNKRKFK
jgi:hypothetical protein